MLLKLFLKIAEEGTLFNSFFTATITLIPKTRQRYQKKKKTLQSNITDKHRCKNPQQNTSKSGLPWSSVIKNPPCNAGDIGSIPDQKTGISHVVGQLSPCATMKTQHSQINKS